MVDEIAEGIDKGLGGVETGHSFEPEALLSCDLFGFDIEVIQGFDVFGGKADGHEDDAFGTGGFGAFENGGQVGAEPWFLGHSLALESENGWQGVGGEAIQEVLDGGMDEVRIGVAGLDDAQGQAMGGGDEDGSRGFSNPELVEDGDGGIGPTLDVAGMVAPAGSGVKRWDGQALGLQAKGGGLEGFGIYVRAERGGG